MMHIVHLANFYTPTSGGLRTTVHALADEYAAAGHRFTLVVPGPSTARFRTAERDRIELAGPRVPGMGGYRVILRRGAVHRVLEHLRPDVVEVSDRATLRHAARWAAHRGIPAVFFAHERLDGVLRGNGMPEGAARRLADRHNRSTAAAFDRIVATTRFAGAEFSRIGASTRVEFVPLGVPMAPMVPPQRHAGERVELLLCSRLSREKRPDLAVSTVAELLRRGVPVHLTVAGDGPERERLERMSAGLPVTFVGHLTDRGALAQLQAGVDLALAPGPIETFGLAAAECLAAGTAVVVSACSALPEVIGGSSAAGEPADPTPEAFADAVQRLLAIPRARRAAAAQARAATFTWSATVSALLTLHHRLRGPATAGPVTDTRVA
jgi:alpha-1,6-mannosyltransferase